MSRFTLFRPRTLFPALVLWASLFGGQSSSPLATLNGTPITSEEYGAYLMETIGIRPLRGLINRKLVAQEAERLGIHLEAKAVSAAFDEAWATLLERWQGDSEKAATELETQGFTQETYRALVEGSRRHDLLSAAICKQTREVTPLAIHKQFELEYGVKGRRPEVRHIFLATKLVEQDLRDSSGADPTPARVHAEMEKQIDQFLEQLRAGADFAALSKDHSHDSTSKVLGGKLTTHGIAQYGTPFATGVRTAAVGLPTGPVFTARGAHLIEVTARVTTRLEDVREELRKQLQAAPADFAELGALEERLFSAAEIEGL